MDIAILYEFSKTLYRFLINNFYAKICGSDSFCFLLNPSLLLHKNYFILVTQILQISVCSLHDSFPKITCNISYRNLCVLICIISPHTCQHTALHSTVHKFSSSWTRDFLHHIWPAGQFTAADTTNNPYRRYLQPTHVCL